MPEKALQPFNGRIFGSSAARPLFFKISQRHFEILKSAMKDIAVFINISHQRKTVSWSFRPSILAFFFLFSFSIISISFRTIIIAILVFCFPHHFHCSNTRISESSISLWLVPSILDIQACHLMNQTGRKRIYPQGTRSIEANEEICRDDNVDA